MAPRSGPSPAPILALHPGALGDVLQAVPALRALAGAGPVALAAQGRLAALLRDTGVVVEALPFDAIGLEALFTADLPAPPALRDRAAVVSWFGAADAVFARRLRAAAPRWLIASPTGEAASRLPVWRQLLDGVASLGVAAGAPGPPADALVARLAIPRAWGERARDALAAAGADPRRAPLVLHPGAGGTHKRWPPGRFAAVVERLDARPGLEVVVHQGPADAEPVRALLALLGTGVPRLVEPELPVLAGVLALAAGYLGGDSGVSQLAAAAGAPGVIVYPPDTRERWAPWSASALAVTASGDPGQGAEVAQRLAERLRPAAGSISDSPPGTTGASRPSSRASP